MYFCRWKIILNIISNRSIWALDRTLTAITTPVDLGLMTTKEYFTFLSALELESHNRAPISWGCRGCNQHIFKKKHPPINNVIKKIWEIIIIIMSRRLRGYPWPSLAISPYHSSPPAGLQDYNPCPHIAAVCKFVLVVPHLHMHEWGSTGVHRLWARPCFSSSVPRVWFVELV